MTQRLSRRTRRSPPQASEDRVAELERTLSSQRDTVCQTLGRVLGYPAAESETPNRADNTTTASVEVGPHSPETIAEEAAKTIARLRAEVQQKAAVIQDMANRLRHLLPPPGPTPAPDDE